MVLKLLDLFSGIGGFSYAGEKIVGGFKTTQFVEVDPYCQSVLRKNFPNIPIHDDIRTFTAKPGQFDVITAGFPCQDLSVAGRQKGIGEGTRSGLFYEIIRLLGEIQPKFVLFENVRNLLSHEKGTTFQEILFQIAKSGYSAEWSIISAKDLGACHKRERLWIVAYPNSDRVQSRIQGSILRERQIFSDQLERSEVGSEINGCNKNASNSNDYGQQGGEFETRNQDVTRQNTQGEWSTNTEDIERQGNDGSVNRKSRIDENLSRSSNGRKTTSTNTRGVRKLSKGTDNNKGIDSQDNYQKNNNRTLVSEGQSRVQLSNNRELGRNQTTSEDNSIRYGDDNYRKQRMENQRSNVTNSDNDGSSSTERVRIDGKTNSSSQEGKNKISKSEGSSKSESSGIIQPITEIKWDYKGHRLNPNWKGYISEPTLRGGDDGLSNRVLRLKALGNSIVPNCAAIPLQRIKELSKEIC